MENDDRIDNTQLVIDLLTYRGYSINVPMWIDLLELGLPEFLHDLKNPRILYNEVHCYFDEIPATQQEDMVRTFEGVVYRRKHISEIAHPEESVIPYWGLQIRMEDLSYDVEECINNFIQILRQSMEMNDGDFDLTRKWLADSNQVFEGKSIWRKCLNQEHNDVLEWFHDRCA